MFRPVFLHPLSPQALRRYDPPGTRLQPLVVGEMARPASSQLPASLPFPPRSTKYLQLCHRKRCAPNRGERLLEPTTAQNYDALTAQSNPTRNVPLQQDYAQSNRESLHAIVPRLSRAYHSAFWLVRSLLPGPLGKRRFLRNATRIGPQRLDRIRRAQEPLQPET